MCPRAVAGPRTILAGLVVLAFYAGLAVAGFSALTWVWRPAWEPGATLAAVGTATLVVGYLSYRLGTARLLADLEATELPHSRAPGFYRRFETLTDRMDVTRPRVLVTRLSTPNAFALGSPRNGVVVLDRSLFGVLSAAELEAIVAHELAHLEGHDALVRTLAYTAVRTLTSLVVLVFFPGVLLAVGVTRGVARLRGRPATGTQRLWGRFVGVVERGVMAVFVLVTVIVLAHSRRREYAADDRAVEVTGDPFALARALQKVERVANPRKGQFSPLYVQPDEDGSRLFSTHPSTEQRVERLLERARGERTRISVG